MIALAQFARDARAWLDSVEPMYGREARRGLPSQDALALGRRYMAARHDAGFAGIDWATEIGGRGLSPLHKIAFEVEESARSMPTGFFSVTLGMAVPIIARHAAERDWVRERVVKALRGEEIWCQMFSEPSAGSDLAGLRTRAEANGNGWKLNGQKVWISWAHYSDYAVVLARSDPTVPKHKGLTYFWIDMRSPGVEVRPIKLADGDSHVNEVFLDDVAVPDTQRIGEVGGGFAVAIETLMIERYVATDPAGFGPSLDNFIALARRCEVDGRPALEDGRVRQAIARAHATRAGLEAITARAMLMLEAGMEPGPEGSLNKLVSVRGRQRLSELAIDLQGSSGVAYDPHAFVREDWTASWLNAPTGRIAGGADEMLLNTIAEKILGLPQDHRPDKGVPFNQIPA